MNYRDFLQKLIYVVINPIIKAMIAIGITPNVVTTVGFVGNLVATGLFIAGGIALQEGDAVGGMALIGWGGFTILFAGLFDMMDGRLARMGNMSSILAPCGTLRSTGTARWSRCSAFRSYSLTRAGSGQALLPMQPS